MLEIENLNVSYSVRTNSFFGKEKLRAVEDVSFKVGLSETIGLVGESGCGKSTLGRAILKLISVESGSVKFYDTDLLKLNRKEMRPFRKKIQVVFQDPYSSLNPRMTIGEIVTEGLFSHENISRKEGLEKAVAILKKVNLDSTILKRYPHEFSGGQRQRIAIARALIVNPEFIICDEAVSALDVSTQAQVINLLIDLKEERKYSYLFISHDLNIIRHISDKIAVMYLGKIVEFGSKKQISESPKHPYTKALFSSVFDIFDRKKKREILKGEIPSILNKPTGCHFHTRCPIAKEICKTTPPEWKVFSNEHKTTCHFV
ncbi:MAG: ABC transporter ATP-binding protein [Leptospiraceae bacterium]|nr:ABC transporter ATP-binding protein [Leptospiraceae bacterium]MCK6382530.1 ABC transporter ATP-binding protein [Leptospiraceae bacterium]NUM42075.1 ABC transporter ATP-binding protein [Leptospiraceae bacterium]